MRALVPRVIAGVVATAFVVVACGGDDDESADDENLEQVDQSENPDEPVEPESPDETGRGWTPLPLNAQFDYQIGGDYEPPVGTQIVSRDWFGGAPLAGGYSICYVNAFQTQDNDPDEDRPDERSNWPAELVLTDFEDDPNWDGEYLIDLSTSGKRSDAAEHVDQMIRRCAEKGFDAVEYDNLNSWDRLADLPFGEEDAVAFAALITERAHELGMAVSQKNTPELDAVTSLDVIGFDFAIAEECGDFDECSDYTDVFGDRLVVIEYTDEGFAKACATVGDRVSVVQRDVLVTRSGSDDYRYEQC